jgi:hypothetical protein
MRKEYKKVLDYIEKNYKRELDDKSGVLKSNWDELKKEIESWN